MRVEDRITYRRALRHSEHEERDLCSSVDVAALEQLFELASVPHAGFAVARHRLEGASIPFGGRILKDIPGMGKVYDWRGSQWTSSMIEGSINPIIFVQHIPVIPQMAGIADFIRLRDVLVAQGLGVHNTTDGAGNVGLFVAFNKMCYQARGANQFSIGTEHMHLTVGEEWSRRQLRASAWLVNLAKEKANIPVGMADLEPGNGICRVARRGQTSHQMVSDMAGYHDRVDPGKGYDWEYVYHAVIRWRERIAAGTADNLGFTGI